MTPAELIEQYVKLRATKASIVAEHEAALKPYSEALETIELALLDWLNVNGLDNFKSPHGTAFKKNNIGVKLVDREALIDFVKETDDFGIFTNNLTKEYVKEYLEKNSRPPPGVEVSPFTVVNVRKG